MTNSAFQLCKDDPYCMRNAGHSEPHDYELPPIPFGQDADQCVNCGYFFPDNSTHFENCNTEEDAARMQG